MIKLGKKYTENSDCALKRVVRVIEIEMDHHRGQIITTEDIVTGEIKKWSLFNFREYFNVNNKDEETKTISVTHIHEILPYTFNSFVSLPNGEIIQKQLVKGKSNTYKVIYSGNVTIVILEDGSKGVAKRNPSDKYSKQIGHDIAHARARIERDKKEIKQLIKTQKAEERCIRIN